VKVALVVGSSGLIGKNVIYELLNNKEYVKVIALSRKDLLIHHDKLEQHIIDFDNIEKYSNVINADDVFCCMGTTVKQTPNLEDYRKIDVTYPAKVAMLAKENGANQVLLVSAMGADKSSNIFYNRIKAEAEYEISKLGYKSVSIFRPSLLMGYRRQFRLAEKIAQVIMKFMGPFFIGPLKKYKAIKGISVAKVMVKVALQANEGRQILENDKILDLV